MAEDKLFCPFVLLASRQLVHDVMDDYCRKVICGIWNREENRCGFSLSPESESLIAIKEDVNKISAQLGNNLDISA